MEEKAYRYGGQMQIWIRSSGQPRRGCPPACSKQKNQLRDYQYVKEDSAYKVVVKTTVKTYDYTLTVRYPEESDTGSVTRNQSVIIN